MVLFLRDVMGMITSIYKDEEVVIAENRLDFMGIMAVKGRIWLVTVMSEYLLYDFRKFLTC